MIARIVLILCAAALAACQTGTPGATLRTEQAFVQTTPLTLQVRSDHCFLSRTSGGPVDTRIWQVYGESVAGIADLVAIIANCAEIAGANDGFGQSVKSIGLVYVRLKDGTRQRLHGVTRAAYIDALVRAASAGTLLDDSTSEENLQRTLEIMRKFGARPVYGEVDGTRTTLVEHDHAGVIVRQESTRTRNFSEKTELTIIGFTLVDGWPVTVEYSVNAGVDAEIVALDVVKSVLLGLAGEAGTI
ncbi:MAG: hypothetical protein VYB54_15185 [Pseudomonadota bacterium]|nr:hypothetical protein [Pseudomonadota bacterium]